MRLWPPPVRQNMRAESSGRLRCTSDELNHLVAIERDLAGYPEMPGTLARFANGPIPHSDLRILGGRSGIRTLDLWLRRPTLYPAELTARLRAAFWRLASAFM